MGSKIQNIHTLISLYVKLNNRARCSKNFTQISKQLFINNNFNG